uniref:Uncharacterized protein n=1 Tax=Magallana gigas TaxID=29159 RepID=A0A8W8NYS1_MAGGI
MFNRFNRHSLKKMEQPPIDLDDDIQGNQEAASKIPDLDISINLPEDTRVNSHWNPPQEMTEIQEALEKRLILSKRKESVNHGLRTGPYPSWFSARTLGTYYTPFQLQMTNNGNRTVTGHPKENPDETADKTISAAITR